MVGGCCHQCGRTIAALCIVTKCEHTSVVFDKLVCDKEELLLSADDDIDNDKFFSHQYTSADLNLKSSKDAKEILKQPMKKGLSKKQQK